MTSKKISGNELRDRILTRVRAEQSEPNEEARIEALAVQGNRDLLAIIATKRPASINDLSALAGRLQPNVSRSLAALVRAGLVIVAHEGRASVPQLSEVGLRKVRDLGISERPTATEESPAAQQPELLSLTLPMEPISRVASDAVEGDIAVTLLKRGGWTPITATTHADLNEVCVRLLANWWRLLCRRDDPFRLFPIGTTTRVESWEAALSVRSTGDRIEIIARPIVEDATLAAEELAVFVPQKLFASTVSDQLIRPVARWLRTGGRFDRPVQWMLNRMEDSMQYSDERRFCETAGALGKSPYDLDDTVAEKVRKLITSIPDDAARLDFASAIIPENLDQTLRSIDEEVETKARTNKLHRLTELRQRCAALPLRPTKPYRIGVVLAQSVRQIIGLDDASAVGGTEGLLSVLGGEPDFSSADQLGWDQLRGFLARGDQTPVVILHSEGSRSTARAAGDYLAFGNREAPIADIYTDRQAVGRAFAAELLAPARGVIRMVDEGGLMTSSVAAHYGVANDVIHWQYNNNVQRHALA